MVVVNPDDAREVVRIPPLEEAVVIAAVMAAAFEFA